MEAGEAEEAGTEPGPLAEAVRSGRDRAGHALARHRGSHEALEGQEGFDGAAHEEAARKLAQAVEERERLPAGFETPEPASPEDLPPADDPPEETYEDGLWTGCEDRIDDDRADGAEHDWLYQRRNGYAELYDPWTPENIELRGRDRLAGEERRCGNDPGNADRTDDPDREEDDWFDSMEFAPGHDRT